MNDSPEMCECGKPAQMDEDGFVTTLDNGMHNLPICEDCWLNPENIAIDVIVDVARDAHAARLPYNVTYDKLDSTLKTAMATYYSDALTARDMTDDDGSIFAVITADWNDWYA